MVTNSGANQIVMYPYTASGLGEPVVIAGAGGTGKKDGPCREATFASPWGIAITTDGNLLVAGNGTPLASTDNLDQSVRYIDQKTGMVTTFAGSGTSGNVDGTVNLPAYGGVKSSELTLPAAFGAPSAICVDKNGTVYVYDRQNNCVKKIVTIEK